MRLNIQVFFGSWMTDGYEFTDKDFIDYMNSFYRYENDYEREINTSIKYCL